KRMPLDGATRERVKPALDALADLFEHRQCLGEVFERAKELRASMSTIAFWENDDKLRQIQRLLDGPSVHAGTRAIPLAERSLLDVGVHEISVSPEQLLAGMARAFEMTRDAVLAVGQAWKTLEPALEQMEREAAELHALAESLGQLEMVRLELGRI